MYNLCMTAKISTLYQNILRKLMVAACLCSAAPGSIMFNGKEEKVYDLNKRLGACLRFQHRWYCEEMMELLDKSQRCSKAMGDYEAHKAKRRGPEYSFDTDSRSQIVLLLDQISSFCSDTKSFLLTGYTLTDGESAGPILYPRGGEKGTLLAELGAIKSLFTSLMDSFQEASERKLILARAHEAFCELEDLHSTETSGIRDNKSSKAAQLSQLQTENYERLRTLREFREDVMKKILCQLGKVEAICEAFSAPDPSEESLLSSRSSERAALLFPADCCAASSTGLTEDGLRSNFSLARKPAFEALSAQRAYTASVSSSSHSFQAPSAAAHSIAGALGVSEAVASEALPNADAFLTSSLNSWLSEQARKPLEEAGKGE